MEKKIGYDPKKNSSVVLIFILFIFLFLWYSQLTNISGGPISFVKKSFSNLGEIFNEDVQVDGNSPLQNILLFTKSVNYGELWKEYQQEVRNNYFEENEESVSSLDSSQTIKFSDGLIPSIKLSLNISFIRTLLEFSGRFLLVIGVFFFFLYSRKRNEKIFLSIIVITSLCFLVGATFLPFFSDSYDLPRFYQQFLIVLSIFSPLGFFILLKHLFKQRSFLIISLFFIIYILVFLGLVYQFTGGISATMRFNNIGFEYDSRYIHSEELTSSNWFVLNNYGGELYLDTHSQLVFFLVETSSPKMNTREDLLVFSIKKNSYVYSGYLNKNKNVIIKSFSHLPLSFTFPTKFLYDNKDKVYNNGGSEIFR